MRINELVSKGKDVIGQIVDESDGFLRYLREGRTGTCRRIFQDAAETACVLNETVGELVKKVDELVELASDQNNMPKKSYKRLDDSIVPYFSSPGGLYFPKKVKG